MDLKSVPWYVWLIPIAVLIIATAKLPYGYYTFARILVCSVAGLVALASWDDGKIARLFAVLLIFVAILFNPLIPIYLTRSTWFYLDIGTAIIFTLHLFAVRLKTRTAQANKDARFEKAT